MHSNLDSLLERKLVEKPPFFKLCCDRISKIQLGPCAVPQMYIQESIKSKTQRIYFHPSVNFNRQI